ncbi:MAG: hypothetical protein FWC00_05550 [Firmicutes bacterium]|nr:hypothetical protein [Bacillota bacterium]
MKNKTLQEQWITHVKQWNYERFGVAEYIGHRQKTLDEAKQICFNAINEFLKEEKITYPFKQTYSNKGMTIIQEMIYLVERTANVLGQPTLHSFLCSIIYDGFNIKHGKKGLLEIIGRYVKWVKI